MYKVAGGGGETIDFATSKYFGHKCTCQQLRKFHGRASQWWSTFQNGFYIYFMWGFLLMTYSNFDFKYIVR